VNIGESKDRQETLYDLWTNILLFLFVASGVSTLVFGLLCVLSGFSLYKGIGLVGSVFVLWFCLKKIKQEIVR